jgi:hypothetical protein
MIFFHFFNLILGKYQSAHVSMHHATLVRQGVSQAFLVYKKARRMPGF